MKKEIKPTVVKLFQTMKHEIRYRARFKNEVQQIEYNRLVIVIKDNFDLIVDIEKKTELDTTPEVITAKESLLYCLKILHKSSLMDIQLFTKDLDQFEKECTNCRRCENELEYNRLVQLIRDKLDVIADIKRQNVLKIPPEVITGKKRLFNCLEILHKQGKE